MNKLSIPKRTISAWVYVYLFLWTVIAVVAATTSFIALGATTLQQWLFYVYSMLVYFYVWGVLAWLLFRHVHRLPNDRRSLLIMVFKHLAILAVITASLPFLIHPQTWRNWLYGVHAPGFHSLNAFIYSFVLIGSQLLRYYRMSRDREKDAAAAELRSIELQKDLHQARVNVLRSQINPHFLFNTLNSISSLVLAEQNEEAVRVTGLLGSLLRTALEETNTTVLTLEQELDFLRRYVEIEKIRFGDKFEYRQIVEPECLPLNVPSLFLQPIVENAVKYAVSPSSSPITVELRAWREAGRVCITITDNGPGLSNEVHFKGIGLGNVRERLTLLHGDLATLKIENNDPTGVLVSLRFPADTCRNPAHTLAVEPDG